METDEFLQVVALNSGATSRRLLGGSLNAIVVGRTDGNQRRGKDARAALVSPLRRPTPSGLRFPSFHSM